MSSLDIENISGLHNYGFNCFMNSAIQCLKFTPSLIKNLAEEEEEDKKILKLINDCDNEDEIETNSQLKSLNINLKRVNQLNIYFHFRKVIKELFNTEKTIDPKHLYFACKKEVIENSHDEFHINLFRNNQCDPQEFLTYLLDMLHEAKQTKNTMELTYDSITDSDPIEKKLAYKAEVEFKKQHKMTSWYVEEFYFTQANVTNCKKCSYYTINFTSTNILNIPIVKNKTDVSLYDYLNDYFGLETLDEWKCDKCPNNEGNTRQYRMMNCPKTLIIQLERFNKRIIGGRYATVKLAKHIEYPMILDMKEYKLINKTIENKYELYGVVNHIGSSTNSGHYYSYCRNLMSTKDDQSWYELNDTSISKIPSSKIVNKNAYMLFYRRID